MIKNIIFWFRKLFGVSASKAVPKPKPEPKLEPEPQAEKKYNLKPAPSKTAVSPDPLYVSCKNAVDESAVILSRKELAMVVEAACKEAGIKDNVRLYYTDLKYKIVSKDAVRLMLKWSKVNDYLYYEDYADCDDYAYMLRGQLPLEFRANGIAVARGWGKQHADNVMVWHENGENKVGIVEPQTDSVKTFMELKKAGKVIYKEAWIEF